MGSVGSGPGADGLRIRVLGPLEVWADGQQVEVRSPKQRAVLGVLVTLAPAAVPVQRFVDEIWGGAGPAALATLDADELAAAQECGASLDLDEALALAGERLL